MIELNLNCLRALNLLSICKQSPYRITEMYGTSLSLFSLFHLGHSQKADQMLAAEKYLQKQIQEMMKFIPHKLLSIQQE